MYINRYLEKTISEDLSKKMVFLGGPRQTGKTTLAKQLCENKGFNLTERYLNWDYTPDRELLLRENFPSGKGILVLDEFHKHSNWRQILKGLFDKRGHELNILMTGSARLDYYRRGGDSLQGRYHFHTLFPLTLAELNDSNSEALEQLMQCSGFPEPFTEGSEQQAKRWSLEYRSRIIHGDLRDLESVRDISLIERLAIRLPDLVGSPLSLNSLREDLQVSHQSIERWVLMLENLYSIFRIYPFGSPLIRAVKKEAKHYHFDWTQVIDRGIRFENLVAVHLLKWCTFRLQTFGEEYELRYFRDTDRREVDFVILKSQSPVSFIECKLKKTDTSRSLRYLHNKFPSVEAIQLICDTECDFVTKEGIRVVSAEKYLSGLV